MGLLTSGGKFIILLSAILLVGVWGYLTFPLRAETNEQPLINATATVSHHSAIGRTHHPVDTVELGQVNWLRDYDVAVRRAEETQKPIFLLFQEVPGCMNCQRFGREVMSNPLIVDIIETEFIPVCIFNNHPGKDAVVLKQFREPSWNNPVVRIVDPKGADLVSRMPSFHPLEIVGGIDQALKKEGREIPIYFQLLHKQITAQYGKVEEAVFPMYCFWSGELKLGQIEGVVDTEPGFMNGKEVVKLQFNTQQTSYQELIQQAVSLDAIEGAYVHNDEQKKQAARVIGQADLRSSSTFRADRQPKYYLHRTLYKHIPMLPLQRIHLNRAIYQRKDPKQYLSSSQLSLLNYIQQYPSRNWADYSDSQDLVTDWEEVQSKWQ